MADLDRQWYFVQLISPFRPVSISQSARRNLCLRVRCARSGKTLDNKVTVGFRTLKIAKSCTAYFADYHLRSSLPRPPRMRKLAVFPIATSSVDGYFHSHEQQRPTFRHCISSSNCRIQTNLLRQGSFWALGGKAPSPAPKMRVYPRKVATGQCMVSLKGQSERPQPQRHRNSTPFPEPEWTVTQSREANRNTIACYSAGKNNTAQRAKNARDAGRPRSSNKAA